MVGWAEVGQALKPVHLDSREREKGDRVLGVGVQKRPKLRGRWESRKADVSFCLIRPYLGGVRERGWLRRGCSLECVGTQL